MKYFWRIVALPVVLLASVIYWAGKAVCLCFDQFIEGAKFWTHRGDT